MDSLPDRCVEQVFRWCSSIADLVQWQSINKQFRRIGNSEEIWRPLALLEYEQTSFGDGSARAWVLGNCRRIWNWRRWLAMLVRDIERSGLARYKNAAQADVDLEELSAAAMALRFRGKRTPARQRLEDFAEFLDTMERLLKPNPSAEYVDHELRRLSELSAKIESCELKPHRPALLAIVRHYRSLLDDFHVVTPPSQTSERVSEQFAARLEFLRAADKAAVTASFQPQWPQLLVLSLPAVMRQPDSMLPYMCAASWCLAFLAMPDDGDSVPCDVCSTAAADCVALRRREHRDRVKLRTSHSVFFACSGCLNPFGACPRSSLYFRDEGCVYTRETRPRRMIEVWRSVRADYEGLALPRVAAKRAAVLEAQKKRQSEESVRLAQRQMEDMLTRTQSQMIALKAFGGTFAKTSPASERRPAVSPSHGQEESDDEDDDATELFRPSGR